MKVRSIRWKVSLILATTHTLFILTIWYLYTVTTDDDRTMIWIWAYFVGFPSSTIAWLIEPTNGWPAALTFALTGGMQWALLGLIWSYAFVRKPVS